MKAKTMPIWVINLFFYLGLISGFLFRSTIIFNRFNPALGRIVWYTAVSGYILFFGYRFYISKKRRAVINSRNLIYKLKKTDLPEDDKESMVYLLESLVKSKEMFNYILIFILSGLAITLDIVFTLLEG